MAKLWFIVIGVVLGGLGLVCLSLNLLSEYNQRRGEPAAKICRLRRSRRAKSPAPQWYWQTEGQNILRTDSTGCAPTRFATPIPPSEFIDTRPHWNGQADQWTAKKSAWDFRRDSSNLGGFDYAYASKEPSGNDYRNVGSQPQISSEIDNDMGKKSEEAVLKHSGGNGRRWGVGGGLAGTGPAVGSEGDVAMRGLGGGFDGKLSIPSTDIPIPLGAKLTALSTHRGGPAVPVAPVSKIPPGSRLSPTQEENSPLDAAVLNVPLSPIKLPLHEMNTSLTLDGAGSYMSRMRRSYSPPPRAKPPRIPTLQLPRPTLDFVRHAVGLSSESSDTPVQGPIQAGRQLRLSKIRWK